MSDNWREKAKALAPLYCLHAADQSKPCNECRGCLLREALTELATAEHRDAESIAALERDGKLVVKLQLDLSALRGLLAVMNADGGHKQNEVGIAEAVKEALEKYHKLWEGIDLLGRLLRLELLDKWPSNPVIQDRLEAVSKIELLLQALKK